MRKIYSRLLRNEWYFNCYTFNIEGSQYDLTNLPPGRIIEIIRCQIAKHLISKAVSGKQFEDLLKKYGLAGKWPNPKSVLLTAIILKLEICQPPEVGIQFLNNPKTRKDHFLLPEILSIYKINRRMEMACGIMVKDGKWQIAEQKEQSTSVCWKCQKSLNRFLELKDFSIDF